NGDVRPPTLSDGFLSQSDWLPQVGDSYVLAVPQQFLQALAAFPLALIATSTSWSLGAANLKPPSTCRGTMNTEDSIRVRIAKVLREVPVWFSCGAFMESVNQVSDKSIPKYRK